MSHDNNSNDFSLPPPPSEKWDVKVVALAVICIVLAAGLVSVLIFYHPNNLQAQITEKNKIISALQQNNTNLQNNNTSDNSQIANLNSQLKTANGDLNQSETTIAQDNVAIAGYQNVKLFTASQVLVNQHLFHINNSNSTDVYDNELGYAGYIVVEASSTSSTTYVRTAYSIDGVNFNQTVVLGTSGSAAFPVLPSATTPVDVKVGNLDPNLSGSSNSTVTITYYY